MINGRSRLKTLAFDLGFCMMVTGCIMFYGLFLVTYFSPYQESLIGVNGYGEANGEFVVFSLLAPFLVYFIKKVLFGETVEDQPRPS